MPSTRTLRRYAALAAVMGLMQPAAFAADPQPYDVKLTPTGDTAIDAALKDSSSLDGLQKTAPVGPFALVTRAQGDLDRLQTALHSFGYYDAHAKIDIDGHAADDPALPDLLAAMPADSTAHVTITVDRGPLFHLRHVTITGDVPAEARAKLGVASGDPAIASQVIAGQSNILDALRASGHALAKVSPPDVLETPAEKVLDVTYHVDAGPRVDIGAITVDGLKETNDSYVRRRLSVHPGEQYSPAVIDAARQDLSAAGIFSSVDASIPDHLAPDGTIPLTFTVTERDRHSVAFNVAYATDTGATGGVTFTYRNVFGNAETLKLNAAITQAETNAEVQAPGYNVTATFIQPDFFQRDQTLTSNLGYVKENLYAYSRKAVLANTTLSRKISANWTASIGLSAVQERVLQEGITRSYTLAAVPVGVTYDTTGPEGLFNPTHGIKAAATITPTDSLAGHGALFTLIQLSGSTYINLAATEGRSVLAVRGLVGSSQGASTFAIPPDQRFYAGGSATVRGYNYQSVGPLFPDQRPQGGTSVTAATIEFRQRFGESFGAVVFVDAGQVGTSSAPFTGTLMEGVGIGARYFTSLGPIRLDIAAPLEKRRKDPIGQVYIGLGQAF
jgi:translocation and assembly module TamA